MGVFGMVLSVWRLGKILDFWVLVGNDGYPSFFEIS